MARNFLLKITSNVAPEGIGRPIEAAQWEGGTFSPGHSTKTALPENGDKIYIWINEEPRPELARQIEPGYGLTASANMLGEPNNSGLSFTQVRIIPEGVLNNKILKTTYKNDSLLSAFGTSAVQPLREISKEAADRIEEIIANALPPTPPETGPDAPRDTETGGSRGQGFRAWAQHRLLIEERAMDVARGSLEREGWVICDRSRTESYDLLCSRGERRVYAEVKGTASAGDQIIITHAEVEFAREHQQGMLLVVVSGIEVIQDESGGVSANGGTPTVFREWAPQTSQLRAISYGCTLNGRTATNCGSLDVPEPESMAEAPTASSTATADSKPQGAGSSLPLLAMRERPGSGSEAEFG